MGQEGQVGQEGRVGQVGQVGRVGQEGQVGQEERPCSTYTASDCDVKLNARSFKAGINAAELP